MERKIINKAKSACVLQQGTWHVEKIVDKKKWLEAINEWYEYEKNNSTKQ